MFTLYAIVVVCVIAVLSAHFSPWARTRRALRGQPRLALGSVDQTYAKIVGTVVAIETFPAPITRRPCVYMEVIAHARSGAGWTEVVREARGVPFLVEDGTVRAFVDPRDATAVLADDAVVGPNLPSVMYPSIAPDPEGWGRKFLVQHDRKPDGDHLYLEQIIEPGERVAVAGHGVREPDPDAHSAERGYRDGPPTRVRMIGSRKYPLLISDRPETTE